MNRGDSLDMLHCFNTGMEMSVLQRQKMLLKWQHEQQLLQPQQQDDFNELSLLAFLPLQPQTFQGTAELLNSRPIKADPGIETGWLDSGMPQSAVTVDKELNGASAGRERFKKRKAEKKLTPKIDAEEGGSFKKSKGSEEEEEESKMTEQNSNSSESKHNKKNREASGCTSKDNNSKASEVQKPDYIHVRARRGQATDSHSLAERVRREKISERMKYLQELVPGCNKITGKAGMLDEIINYVQSLQRQVEFLSMKLAAVNPRLDFNIDDLIAKEVFAACSSSLPDITNGSYLQYNLVQQMNPVCGSEVAINPIDMGLRRAISAPVSLPETYMDPSCFNQIPSALPWDADLQNIYTMEFQHGRSTPFPSQAFTGTIEASSLKMEM